MEISENFTTAQAVKLIIYYFLEKTTRLLFISDQSQCGDYSKYRCCGYYLFQRYRNVATIPATICSTLHAYTIIFMILLTLAPDSARHAVRDDKHSDSAGQWVKG